MCATCGCSGTAVVRLMVADPGEGPAGHRHSAGSHVRHAHAHDHGPQAGHEADHDHRPQAGHEHEADHEHILESAGHGRTVELQQKVLAKNDAIAQLNRDWLAERSILAVNLMSSPGAGKTTLLERTVRDLAGQLTISVIEGDQETALDARRILAAGSRVVQINTGAGCHLDAEGSSSLHHPVRSLRQPHPCARDRLRPTVIRRRQGHRLHQRRSRSNVDPTAAAHCPR